VQAGPAGLLRDHQEWDAIHQHSFGRPPSQQPTLGWIDLDAGRPDAGLFITMVLGSGPPRNNSFETPTENVEFEVE